MKELRFDNLNMPEYYIDRQGYDCRIAIRKLLDARETMGFALASLSYIEPSVSDKFESNFVKVIHLRHIIADLNSSFDLLLQVPWMYYRAWEFFNQNGILKSKNLKNKNEIIRNTNDWVYLAEKECSIWKVLKYLEHINNPLRKKIKKFYDNFIVSNNKVFTVVLLPGIGEGVD